MPNQNQNGIVYVLVNEAMPGIVKVGCTTNLAQRLKTLDNTSTPEPFECFYAATVTDMHRTEQLVHRAFGDRRVRSNREFFRIAPEQVVAALQLAGDEDVTPRPEDYIEDAEDRERLNKTQERRENFNFEMLNIPIGSRLYFNWDEEVFCTVADKTKVDFRGEIMSISGLTRSLLGLGTRPVQGTLHWTFDGEVLAKRRLRLEAERDVIVQIDHGKGGTAS